MPISSGNLLGGTSLNPLQSSGVINQLQNNLQQNPVSALAEISAQNQQGLKLQSQKQQQSVLSALQAQQQHLAVAQSALAGNSASSAFHAKIRKYKCH